MKILTASVVIEPLMLIGALSVAAGQSISSSAPIQLAAASPSTADRDSYTQKMRHDMAEWRQNLQNFGGKAKVKGQKEGGAAENDVNAARIKTEGEWRKLQTASAKDRDGAKTSFEKAAHERADAGSRVRSEDK